MTSDYDDNESSTEVWDLSTDGRSRGRGSYGRESPPLPQPIVDPSDTLASRQHDVRSPIRRVLGPNPVSPTPRHVRVSRHSQQSVSLSNTSSVWKTYRKEYEVNFGAGYLWVASYTSRTRGLALVDTKQSWVVRHQKNLLDQLRDPSFVQYLDMFESPSETHFVLEYMDMSLVQLAVALRYPSEQEIRAIVGQVSGPCNIPHR